MGISFDWDSPELEPPTKWALRVLYLFMIMVPLIQLIRIQLRTGNMTWTTQKLFFFLILLPSVVRFAFFFIVPFDDYNKFFNGTKSLDPLYIVLDTLPGIIYFSAFSIFIFFLESNYKQS